MKTFIRNNSLCICFLLLFAGAMTGQIIFGFQEHNRELTEDGSTVINLTSYLISGHIIQVTFQNWQSEFLSVFAIVMLFFIYAKLALHNQNRLMLLICKRESKRTTIIRISMFSNHLFFTCINN